MKLDIKRAVAMALLAAAPVALGGFLFTRSRGPAATRQARAALARNDYGRVRDLAPHVSDVDVRSPDGATPLLAALEHGDLQTARLLLTRGADVNRRRATGRAGVVLESPLDVAITRGDAEAVRLLLAHGARVELRHAAIARYGGNADIALPGQGAPFDNAVLQRRRRVIAPLLERALSRR